ARISLPAPSAPEPRAPCQPAGTDRAALRPGFRPRQQFGGGADRPAAAQAGQGFHRDAPRLRLPDRRRMRWPTSIRSRLLLISALTVSLALTLTVTLLVSLFSSNIRN